MDQSASIPNPLTREEIGQIVHDYIIENFLFDATKKLGDDESFLGSGVIDSTGVMELITFLGERFGINFQDDELVADNFDSVARVSSFIYRKSRQNRG